MTEKEKEELVQRMVNSPLLICGSWEYIKKTLDDYGVAK